MTQFVCTMCTYPSHLQDACDNPGCEANPRVSETQKVAWRAERERRAAQEAERARIRAIRARMRS
jgi:hypothetical protein